MDKIGFLIDMDGVIYKGNQLIAGADVFIERLRREGYPFLFLTNNSQRTRRDVVTKLKRLGINVGEEHICTCAMATARFLSRQKPKGTAYVIGEGGLLQALHQNGYSIVDVEPDYVVVGEGRTMTSEALEVATRLVLGGAKLIATNIDPNCPTANGIRPGCGAIIAFLETSTGKKALSVGKPSPVMMRAARKQLNLVASQTVVIGDTMETDIIDGVQMGYHTVLALSGGTRVEDLSNFAFRPNHMIESIAELADPTCNRLDMFSLRTTEEDTVGDIDRWREMHLANA